MTTGTAPEPQNEDFSGHLKISQKLPSRSDLARIANYSLLNSKGESVTFSSLCSSRRTMVIFVRHFFCGNCQEYLRTLCEAISPSDLTTVTPPANLIVIGCGSPELISFYREATSCTFPIFTDPDRKLFQALGMTRTKSPGARPAYQQRSLLQISLESIFQGLGRGRRALKGGDFWQVGGEFLIEDGSCLWAHRMETTRDHSEIPVIRKILGLDGGVTPVRKRSNVVVEAVQRRWSRQFSDSNQGFDSGGKRSHSPPVAKIEEVNGPRDSGVEVDTPREKGIA